MRVTLSQTKKILTTKNNFSQLGFNLLITRLSGIFEKDQSEKALQYCTDELNAFLEKYQSILQKDYALITNL